MCTKRPPTRRGKPISVCPDDSRYCDLLSFEIRQYLHIIEAVFTPTTVSKSVYDQSNLNPDFSLLTENIDFVQMIDLVDCQLPITLLAPTNQALRRNHVWTFSITFHFLPPELSRHPNA